MYVKREAESERLEKETRQGRDQDGGGYIN